MQEPGHVGGEGQDGGHDEDDSQYELLPGDCLVSSSHTDHQGDKLCGQYSGV